MARVLADSFSLQSVGNGPYLTTGPLTVLDPTPGGNNNGRLDPGESGQLQLVLYNVGNQTANTVTGVLRSGNPYFVITDSTSAFGTIPANSSASNASDRFAAAASPLLPLGTVVPCTLLLSASGYNVTRVIYITVGVMTPNDPIPDACPPIYQAYDDGDTGYPQRPTYNWVEINPIGTRLSIGDDQTITLTLPTGFVWRWYGQDYTQLSICSNGWVAPGVTTSVAWNNTALPNGLMPAMVALAWDDLNPAASNGIWYYHDQANNRFIIEYDSIAHYSSPLRDKFQLIISNAAGGSDNSVLIAQYKRAYGSATSTTVGMQDNGQGHSIQCLYNGSYHPGALPLDTARAIKYLGSSPVIHDAAVDAITVPISGTVYAPGTATFTPTATIRNAGTVSENIPVTFAISSGYSNSQSIALNAGASGSLSFAPITTSLAPGYYTMTATSTLAGDANPANNQQTGALLVMGQPTLVSPIGGWVTGRRPTFDWNDLAGATSYEIQVSHDAGFTLIEYSATGLTVSQVVPGQDLPDGHYYWRVRGVNNLSGPWSAIAQFGLDATPPAAPTLQLPTNGATGVSRTPTFQWSAVTFGGGSGKDAISYRLQVDTDNPPTSPYVVNTTTTNTTLVCPTTLAYGTTYYWRVQATDDAGNTGAWSTVFAFTTLSVGTPTLLSPAHNALLNTLPTFTWQAVTDANYYNLQVDTDAGFAAPRAIDIGQTGLTYAPATLADGHYYWRVRASADGGVTYGAWSSVWEFDLDRTPPAAPVLVTPTGNGTGVPVDVVFDWTDLSDGCEPKPKLGRSGQDAIGRYDIDVATDRLFANLLFHAEPIVSQYQHSAALDYGTRYYWRVRGTDDFGNVGPYAQDSFVTIVQAPAVPVLVAPSNGATTQPVSGQLVWNAAARAAGYDVYLDTVNPPVAVVSPNQAGTSYGYSGLQHSRTYFWRVVARNAGGQTMSAVWAFTTVAAAPAIPELALPTNGATGLPVAGTLVWHSATGTANFAVYLDTIMPPLRLWAGGLADTTVAYTGLDHGQVYYWQVVANGPGGTAASAVWQFVTQEDSSRPPKPSGWHAVDTATGTPIGAGGCLVYSPDSRTIYQLRGNKTLEFYEFVGADSVWRKLSDVPVGTKPVGKGAALAAGGGFVFVMKGNNTRELYKFDVANQTWSQALRPIPLAMDQSQQRGKAPRGGGSMVYVSRGDSGFVYLLKGSGTLDFFCYDVARDTYYSVPNLPYSTKSKYDAGSWLCYDGFRYIYVMQSRFNALFRYDVQAQAWDSVGLTPLPFNSAVTGRRNKKVGDGSSAAWDGTSIWALKGNNTQEWWRYLPDSGAGTWVEHESMPQTMAGGTRKKKPKAGAGVAYHSDSAAFFAQKGNKTNQFWMYVPGAAFGYQPAVSQEGVQAGRFENDEPAFSIFPNPFKSGTLYLTAGLLGPSTQLVVHDALGRRVLGMSLGHFRTGMVAVDLPQLAVGVYLVTIENVRSTAVAKLVVER